MSLDTNSLGHLLIIVARLLEMFSFLIILIFIFKGVALKHVFITAGITVLGILFSIFGYLGNLISPFTSFAIDALVFFIVLSIAFYAFMEQREFRIMPPPPPSKGTRCPVCGGFVKPEDDYAVAREGKDLIYFDSKEHLESFLKDFKEYKALRRLNIRRVEDVYFKGEKGWKKVEYNKGHEG